MSSAPGVSVVIVTRDRPQLLADAVRSVAAQTLRPVEVRVADDGDLPAWDVLSDAPLLELTTLAVECRQAGAARNLAARGARGELLAFLDDDDLWSPTHLADLAGAFRDPAVCFAWSDFAVVRERVHADGTREALERRVVAHEWDDALMATNDYLPTSAWAVRRSWFEALGGFDESFRFSEDWDFALRSARTHRAQRVRGVSVEVRMREDGHLSGESGAERLDCLARLAARHGLPPLVPRTFWEVAGVVEANA